MSAFFVFKSLQHLGWFDVFGSWALGTTAFGVGHALTFTKFIEAYAIKTRRVKKHVLAGAGVDESETFVRQPLNCTFRH